MSSVYRVHFTLWGKIRTFFITSETVKMSFLSKRTCPSFLKDPQQPIQRGCSGLAGIVWSDVGVCCRMATLSPSPACLNMESLDRNPEENTEYEASGICICILSPFHLRHFKMPLRKCSSPRACAPWEQPVREGCDGPAAGRVQGGAEKHTSFWGALPSFQHLSSPPSGAQGQPQA